ncbi:MULTISPECIES: type IV secretory system conjugative DNA transfer family protein [Paenarthrobacter]|uniref:TraM recognition domain-containing protein n=1 Tax=Paenarthrobacter ureafaciens TaxID=37931 RepID=A0AAX3EPV5_PAEUR|nr:MULTISPECIES: type IV secretory system conjugative DNA transfer family protein [Paenarthrobacter]NKR13736.1 conjugal transfer protein [Arthrobacter sp. M5]NKR18249.1 conjugal transfer protein [Arthrobacter sp. M6]MCX8456559.1 TraM recognition domain-containing protein [Paenarthrobacter ureafaciens]MCY0974422.1 TraM recognition domain-containing protein [Paenarthrobacter ureafaciens]MDO5866963.1 TraM recognition domain-containing protein [Paenarthrobacter sp. SD-2]
MGAPNSGKRSGLDTETTLLWVVIAVVVAGVGSITGAVHLGSLLSRDGQELPANPFELVFSLISHKVTWPATATGVLIGLGVLALVIAVLVVRAVLRRKAKRSRVDAAAQYMAKGRDLKALSLRGATATAERLGVKGSPGVPVGKTVLGGQMVYGSWEDMHIDIWGPRTGKTTSRAIPAILAAPGAALVTSNKRDIVDGTRDVRAADGPVWVFDPQGVALEEPSWWWNPLSYVTDEVRAARLADHFAAGSRGPEAKTDAYFDPAGQDLLAGLLLAAALDDRPITQVHTWLTRPSDDEAVDILKAGGFIQTANAVGGVINAPEKQRGGVYGTALQMASCLTNRQVATWVTPQGDTDTRDQFDPAAFVRSKGTLYSLSKEGKGTAGPLVTALTVAVVEAAEELAVHSPGGRLANPMIGVLDEAANVCRWRELPNLYSHYGSRGIVLMTILQSWSQGVEVWGRDGMRKLWSASNIKVYGGGVAEAEFLGELAQLVGEYRYSNTTRSRSKQGTSHSRDDDRKERTLDVSELAAFPRGRAIMFASGAPAALLETVPWMNGPHAEAVRASIAAHDPSNKPQPAATATSNRWITAGASDD